MSRTVSIALPHRPCSLYLSDRLIASEQRFSDFHVIVQQVVTAEEGVTYELIQYSITTTNTYMKGEVAGSSIKLSL